jgi:hypothetical protein
MNLVLRFQQFLTKLSVELAAELNQMKVRINTWAAQEHHTDGTHAVVTATSLTATGLIASSGTAGVGYTTGAGGTVTQATSKSTGVTLSTTCGEITMNNAALAAATIVSFTLTNTTIAAGDLLLMNHVSGGTVGSYTLNARCTTGSATIDVRNATAGSLSEAVVIRFGLFKGVTS